MAASLTAPTPGQVVVVPKGATRLEQLAGREIVRYVYLRTGRLLPIVESSTGPSIHVATQARLGMRDLKPQEYRLRTTGNRLSIVGGDPIGTLYGAYRLVEKLGVRFYLHGDTIPDERIPFSIPKLDEVGRPLFALRGIQPFHDFPEGPDWWNQDDYLAIIGQLPKMRMNFIGFHAYPESGVGPEPLVWIGPKEDLNPDGSVKASYPAHWANTRRDGPWGYAATKTSEFVGGGWQLFPTDDYGPEVMRDLMPAPRTGSESNLLFDRVGRMLGTAFAQARELGVQTCVGTETPLTVPQEVRKRHPQASVRDLYAGMMERIRRAYPADYFWLWTPEGWTWGGNTQEDFDRTITDLKAAISALPPGMRFATSGWVLGPQGDRSALDRLLPKDVALSAISRQVGHARIDPAFGEVQGRSKWAIPWLENDPAMIAPQLWVGRMRYDAADARRYGCDGLLGIHWRTQAIAPNVAALAAAGWEQPWFGSMPRLEKRPPGPAVGGAIASFGAPVEGTDQDPVYQTVRYGMSAYRFDVPNGTYRVTLQFNEPHYSEPGRRVFGVKVQGRKVVDRLDLFAQFGRNRAHDVVVPDVAVTDRKLNIDFVPQVEFPSIAGIVVEGPKSLKINCGGAAYQDYVADLQTDEDAKVDRTVPVADFYRDFARANFGLPEVGAVLGSVDGTALPEPSTWIEGPGGIKIEPYLPERFTFVDRLAALRPKVRGEGNRQRFDYWLESFRYLREMAVVGGLRHDLDAQMKRGSFNEALATRVRLAEAWSQMVGHLMATVGTPGELGTVANLEQHVLRRQRVLDFHDSELRKQTGKEPPIPSREYRGAPRVIVPTVRTNAKPGEKLQVRAILLAQKPARGATLFWRALGQRAFREIPMRNVGRSVYEASLPVPATGIGVEYHVAGAFADGTRTFPPTAPGLNQTVVVF